MFYINSNATHLEPDMNKAELAKLMNVSESNLESYLAGLSVWIAKGYTVEQAIEKHMQTMQAMCQRVYAMSTSEAYPERMDGLCDVAAGLVWNEVNAQPA